MNPTDEARDRLLAKLLAERGIQVRGERTIPRRPDGAVIPLSGPQRGLWFTERIGLDGGAYVMLAAFRLSGALDAAALRAAVDAVVTRHEALRSHVLAVDGTPVQVVAPAGAVDAGPVLVDLSGHPPAEAEERMRRLVADDADRPFDLETPPLLRSTLFRLNATEHVLLLCAHHIVCDDDSMGLLVGELAEHYAASVTGRQPRLPAIAVQFPDYVLWQADRLDAGERDRQLRHWVDRLSGAPAVLDLPGDRPRPAARTVAGGTHEFVVPADLAARFAELTRRNSCSVFAGLLAAMGVLLARHGAGTDVVIGSPTSTRPRPELDRVVGMFVNPTALRLDVSGDPTVYELLGRARRTALDALGNADVPFDQVAAAVAPQRDLAYHPLFQVMLVLNQAGEPADWPGLTVRGVPAGRATSRFDLTWMVLEGPGAWPAVLDYSTDLFRAGTIARLADRVLAVLSAMVARPGARVSELNLGTEADRAAVAALNDTARVYPPADSVVDLIGAQAARTPDAPAVLALDGSDAVSATLRYADLDRRANAVAHLLRSLGVGPEIPVGLAVPASPDAMVALLAVLKAGGCYVPLDPGHPPRRLTAVLADCGAPILIATPGDPDRFAGYPGVVLDTAHEAFRATEPEPPPVRRHAGQLAYLVYTSGSTGQPKGVEVPHASLLNLTRAFVERHGFAAGQRVLMIPPLSFDASAGDVFPALTTGATLVLHPEPAALSGPRLLRLCAEHAITMVDTAAALWRRWVDDLADADAGSIPDSPLSTMMIGGEAVPAAAVPEWARRTGGRVALYNHYGPTEATVCATTYRTVDGAELTGGGLPIGTPLPNVRVYVLDKDLRPVPVGSPGELCVGGAAPARGYRGAPAATAAAFVPDEFSGVPGARLYRTGDMVRLRDGVLEYLGRADDQVKVRGNRIELGEVRAALAAHPRVAEAAVLVREHALVGYLVPRAGETVPGPAELRAFCAERLPDYMLPSLFVVLDALPLTRHGKLDAAALPMPSRSTQLPEYEAPRTPVERTLAEIWAEVLGNPQVGRRDSFFSLGGHSLVAASVLARVRALLGVTLPLRALFATGDLAELATVVEQARAAADESFGRTYTAGLPPVSKLHEDAVPPEDIAPASGPVAAGAAGPAERVLLTGATGFLGAHLLAELLARTDARVYCLVRAGSPAEGTARVLANLRRARLAPGPDQLARIVPVPGDMAEPRFGLADDAYESLCDRLDAIYHNGAVMNFVLTYQWMMPPHVRSTVEALRMATRRRTKPLHLMSTLGVFLGTNYDKQLVRETDPADDPEGLDTGYHTTKWVADRMAVNARGRGLPISIYRIAAIVGDVRTGTAKTDSYLSRQVSTCAHVGAVPVTSDIIDMLPVDRLAAAIAGLSCRPDLHGRDFHFYRADGFGYADLGTVLTEAGYPTVVEPYAKWRARMLDAPTSAFGPLSYGLPVWGRAHPVFDCSATWEAAASCGVTFPPADAAMMRRHVDFLTSAGVMPRRAASAASAPGLAGRG